MNIVTLLYNAIEYDREYGRDVRVKPHPDEERPIEDVIQEILPDVAFNLLEMLGTDEEDIRKICGTLSR